MADIQTTLGLNYQDFKRGLAQASAEAQRSTREIGGHFESLGGLLRGKFLKETAFKVFEYGSAAIKAFAKDNIDAQNAMKQWEERSEKLNKSIGEDLYHTLKMLDGLGVPKALDWLVNARVGVVDAVATGMQALVGGPNGGETISDVNDAREQSNESAKSIARTRRDRELYLAFGGDANEAAGNKDAAARFREEARHAQELKKIAGEGDGEEQMQRREYEDKVHQLKLQHIDEERNRRLQAIADEFDAAQGDLLASRLELSGQAREAKVQSAVAGYDSRIRSVENSDMDPEEKRRKLDRLRQLRVQAGDMAGAKHDSETNKERESALNRISSDHAQAGIDLYDTQGYRELADLAKLRVTYAQQEADIRTQTSLSQADKELAINQLQADRDRALLAHAQQSEEDLQHQIDTKVGGTAFRGVTAGLGGDRAGSVLASGGGQEDYELKRLNDRQEMFHEREAELLRKIAENTGKAVAIAG